MPLTKAGLGVAELAALLPDLSPLERTAADALSAAQTADAKAVNARDMILRRDPRLEQVEQKETTLEGVVAQLMALSESYAAALPASLQDRQTLHAYDAALDARLKAVEDARVEFDRQTRTLPALNLVSSTAEVALTWRKPFGGTDYELRPLVLQGGVALSAVAVTERSRTAVGVVLAVARLGVNVSPGALLDVIAFRPHLGGP